MLIALLIIARTAHIGASILLAGTFIFELVTLAPARRPASGDLHEVERRLLRLAGWSLIVALLSALLWFWLEVANMRGLLLVRVFQRQRGKRFCLKRNSGASGSFALD